MLDRATILDALTRALGAESTVHAAYLGGSDGFGRADEHSDIDLCVTVADGHADEAFDVLERALESLSPIATKLVIPEPTWHGHRQRFYRLRDAPETLLVDAIVTERSSSAMRFDEREQHGEPVVLFDRLGIVKSRPLDRAAHEAKMRERAQMLVLREQTFGSFADKELRRGRPLDAMWAYNAFLLSPLIEVLRMRHCPDRFHFGQRYLHVDLPADVAARLQSLVYVASFDELGAKIAEARAWLKVELAEITPQG